VTFDESVKYLLSLGNEVLAMKLGLENITRLLAALHHPQNNYFKVQVAGTNGKGSTCAFLEAMCLSAGIKTGLATSPHLISITERVRINGRDISEEEFARHASKVRELSEKLVAQGELEAVPTFFEQVTAIALHAFADAGVELAILETGLGGRFDATTAANADVAVITQIDYDHQAILGETIEEIAAEKAAIIRKGLHVVIAEQRPEAMKVILERCDAVGTGSVMKGFRSVEADRPEVSLFTPKRSYESVLLGLEGEHQAQNACAAIGAADVINEVSRHEITDQNIYNGLVTARHPGRLEWWNRYSRSNSILFDGAHNVAGAMALRKYLEIFMRGEAQITLVFGSMHDKDVLEIGKILFPLARNLILTRSANIRSTDPDELFKIAESIIDKDRIFKVPDLWQALDSATEITKGYSATRLSFICITGSLYLVGEAQKLLNNNRYE
jgi:dihydrofolate synthase/folylpolyglutamate synthase